MENTKCSEYVYTICEWCKSLLAACNAIPYTKKEKKKKETHLNEKAKRHVWENTRIEFVEDKELICSDFYCDEKHESEDYLSATKINFNDKKEDGVIPEKGWESARSHKEPKASMACKGLCLHLCANSAEINNEIEEAA